MKAIYPVYPVTPEEAQGKLERYDWPPAGEKGRFQWIPLEKLEVDHSYQRIREVDEKLLLDIAREWSWALCGALIVCLREGRYLIVDGQGRWLGARRRGDIPELPCFVFHMASPREEALTFSKGQKNRKALKSTDAFRADLRAQDENVVAIQRMIEGHGYTVAYTTSSLHSVKCVGALRRLYAANPAICESVFGLCVRITEGRQIRDELLQGLFYIETVLERSETGKSVLQSEFSSRLLAAGEAAIWQEIQAAKAYYKKGGARVFADGIIKVLNKNRQEKNRISLNGGGAA